MKILVEEKYEGTLVKSGLRDNNILIVASDVCNILRKDAKKTLRFLHKSFKEIATIERIEPNGFGELETKIITVNVINLSGLAYLVKMNGEKATDFKQRLSRTYLPLIKAH